MAKEKSKSIVTVPVEEIDTSPVIIEPIECDFRKINNYPQEGMRSGRYSGSFHWDIKEFAFKKWVILGYLDVDWLSLEKSGKSQSEILLGCLLHLNKTPERKKHAKKDPRPQYGVLEPYKADFKLAKKEGQSPFIIVQFKIDERVNANFWCEGQSWDGQKTGKKRGRPPKVKVEAEQPDV